MRLIIEPNYEQLSKWAANYVAAKIKAANPTAEKPFVLGLPTGSSPLGMYKNLIELNKQGVVSFQNVITFNMDEYVGLPKDHPESYHSFMWNNFFSHIDIKPENVNILNGNAEDLEAECASYEARMKAVGGVDLFLGCLLVKNSNPRRRDRHRKGSVQKLHFAFRCGYRRRRYGNTLLGILRLLGATGNNLRQQHSNHIRVCFLSHQRVQNKHKQSRRLAWDICRKFLIRSTRPVS